MIKVRSERRRVRVEAGTRAFAVAAVRAMRPMEKRILASSW